MSADPWIRAWRLLRAAGEGVVILLLGLVLTELAFRLLHRVSPVFIFPSASYNRLRPEPHSTTFGFTHNSHGFKDVEHPVAKPPGVFRVVGIGDSFVYGAVPYEHNFLTLVERDLDLHRGPAEVINMGIPSTEIADYFSLLVHEGLRFDPDLVIVCFYIGNDFRVSPREEARSYLLAFLHYLFRVMPAYQGQSSRETEYDDNRPTLRQRDYRNILQRKIVQFSAVEPKFRNQFDTAAGYFEKIRRVCDKRGVELLVVLIPDELQVDSEVLEWLRSAAPEIGGDYDFDLPNRELGAELERQGIVYLDLLASLRAAVAGGKVYRPQDTHWNIRGNEIAAREISRALGVDVRPPYE